jgi:ferrous iron transport protein A
MTEETLSLGAMTTRRKALISGFRTNGVDDHSALDAAELERRLMEIGFVEGAMVEIAHVGGVKGDPIAVRIDEGRLVALRRREAACIAVRPIDAGPTV